MKSYVLIDLRLINHSDQLIDLRLINHSDQSIPLLRNPIGDGFERNALIILSDQYVRMIPSKQSDF